MVEDRPLSLPSSRPRWRTSLSVRALLGLVAVVAIGLTLLQRWDFHRRGPASEKLFRPIITHYDQAFESQIQATLACLDLACRRSKPFARRNFSRAVKLIQSGITSPLSFRGTIAWLTTAPSDISQIRADFVDSVITHHKDSGPSVLENYVSALRSIRMAYHATRMSGHFQRLLSERWTTVPPLPLELETERRSLELVFRRTSGDPEYEFSDPPWYLIPGAPKPKWQPKWSSGDSY